MKTLEKPSDPFGFRPVAALAAALALAGCLGGSASPERQFRLSDPTPPPGPAKPAPGGALAVEAFQARGALARERNILYRDQALPNQTQFHPADLWEEPPAAMVQAALARCLGRSGTFEAVVGRDRHIRPRYSLYATLDRLEQRVTAGCSDALIRLDLSVTDDDARKIVLSGTYQAAEPAADGRIEALLPAFDRALARICAEVAGDAGRWIETGTAGAPRRSDPPPPACGR